jgi:hypothetical protein
VDLQVVQRQVISIASLSVQVADVNGAIARVRGIAESLGGFVEHLSSSGGPERPQATVTVRVPQPQFFAALERLEALGEVQGRNVGSQDVSEQFIDLEARLKSAQRQEQSLLSLLQKAQNVTEVLTIERELTRIRGEIERLQGQLNYLQRRVELATISISLLPPKEEGGRPPSASLALEVSRVTERVEAIKERTSALKGKIDNVSISVRNGRETAHIALRVFSKDFDPALTFIEGLGEVQTKDVQEGASGSKEPKEPNAPLAVSLLEAEGPNTGLIVVIAAPIGGVALVGLLGFLFVTTYRAGRRRAQRS